jgi:hypothetical protein
LNSWQRKAPACGDNLVLFTKNLSICSVVFPTKTTDAVADFWSLCSVTRFVRGAFSQLKRRKLHVIADPAVTTVSAQNPKARKRLLKARQGRIRQDGRAGNLVLVLHLLFWRALWDGSPRAKAGEKALKQASKLPQ